MRHTVEGSQPQPPQPSPYAARSSRSSFGAPVGGGAEVPWGKAILVPFVVFVLCRVGAGWAWEGLCTVAQLRHRREGRQVGEPEMPRLFGARRPFAGIGLGPVLVDGVRLVRSLP